MTMTPLQNYDKLGMSLLGLTPEIRLHVYDKIAWHTFFLLVL